MFCPECGAQAPDDARFCGECGQAISQAPPLRSAAAGPVHAEVVDLEVRQGTVSDALKWGIVAASVLIPLVGIIMGIVYLASGDSEEKKSTGRLWLIAGLVIGVFWVLAGGGY